MSRGWILQAAATLPVVSCVEPPSSPSLIPRDDQGTSRQEPTSMLPMPMLRPASPLRVALHDETGAISPRRPVPARPRKRTQKLCPRARRHHDSVGLVAAGERRASCPGPAALPGMMLTPAVTPRYACPMCPRPSGSSRSSVSSRRSPFRPSSGGRPLPGKHSRDDRRPDRPVCTRERRDARPAHACRPASS